MGITGNKVADELADLEAHNPHKPSHKADDPTVTELRTDPRALMRDTQSLWCRQEAETLEMVQETDVLIQHDPREELTLSRHVLVKLLAISTMHGDFAWYHRKYKHDDAVHLCSCEKDKSRTIWYTVHECDAGSCNGLRGLNEHQ